MIRKGESSKTGSRYQDAQASPLSAVLWDAHASWSSAGTEGLLYMTYSNDLSWAGETQLCLLACTSASFFPLVSKAKGAYSSLTASKVGRVIASSAEMAQGCFSAMAPFPGDRVLVAATPVCTKLRTISDRSNHEPGRRARQDLYFWAQRDSGWRSYLEICFHLYWTPKESPGTKDSCKTLLSYSVVRTEGEE